MKRRGLRKRYGHSSPKTSIRTLKHRARLDQHDTGNPGDSVEVGGSAGNSDYLIAYSIQRGDGWKKLGPFATVLKAALWPKTR